MAPLTDIFGLAGNVIDGQFHVHEVIGEGGFSVVYKGQHLGLREPVAIKCLKINKTKDPTIIASFTQRFFDESRISYRLSQGNLDIVRSITSGTTISPRTKDTVPYMVLEWLEGISLNADLKSRRLRKLGGRPIAELMSLFEPAALALAYAHVHGIAHRDVKPGNLFLAKVPGGATKLKVLDFGMAKVLDVGSVGFEGAATINNLMVISPQFSAPEQFEPQIGPIGAWTDVYSLAMVMVEALADRRARTTESFGELMMTVTDPRAQPTPRKLGVNVSDAVEAVFKAALSVDPAARPKDAGELWARLKQAVAARDDQEDTTRTDQKLPDFGRTFAMPAELPPDVQQYLHPPTNTRETTAPMEAMPVFAAPSHNQTLSMVPGANSQLEVARALAMARVAATQRPQLHQPLPPQQSMPLARVEEPAPDTTQDRGGGSRAVMTAVFAIAALAVTGVLLIKRRSEASVQTHVEAATVSAPPPSADAPAPSATVSSTPSASTSASAPTSVAHSPLHNPQVAANTALSMSDARLVSCKQTGGPTGKGTASVTFTNTGSVARVAISAAPFGGTDVGQCVMDLYRATKIAPFDGPPVVVEHGFEIVR